MPALPPLSGLRIVITRPREQAKQLTENIERAGGQAILFPLLEIVPTAHPAALQDIASRLSEFDLAVFVSPNAVRYSLPVILSAGGIPQHTRVATVGQGSALALNKAGVSRVIAPTQQFDSEALLALPELQNMNQRNVVIFRGNGGRPLLGETLKLRGAQVTYVECYRRLPPPLPASTLIAGKPDAITVTSSEALDHLNGMVSMPEYAHIKALPLFASYPRIADLARQLEWQNVTATASGDDGLLSGLVAWAQRRN